MCRFATIPYELLAKAIVGSGNTSSITILAFLRTPRLLRLGRCAANWGMEGKGVRGQPQVQ